jgi:hypothetical protein
MAAKLRKAHLRKCARKVLEDCGYRVNDVGGAGVAPGARLRISKGPNTYDVAVRTSLERKVGLLRNPKGSWMTVPNVDWVVVVTPSTEDPNCAEVLVFKSDVLIDEFDQELAARKKLNPVFSPKAPIFLTLDPSRPGKPTNKGLKKLSKWERQVPLASVGVQRDSKEEGPDAFIARVKREYARQFNVEEENVTVKIEIKG